MTLFWTLCCLLAFVAPIAADQDGETVTPVQKVLQLMNDMLAKGKKEMNDEQVKFSAYSQWCDNQDRIKTKEIAEADEKIEKLNAEIAKATADIEELTARIQELDEDIGRWKKDQTAATTIREKERTDFDATLQDYSESIDALERAINVLKKESADKPQAELIQSLLQVSALRLVPDEMKSALASFLQQDTAATSSAPEANAYESQSGGIIDMLEKLKSDFKKQKLDLQDEEMTAQHGYEGIMQELTDNIENADAEIARKSKVKAEREQDKADAEKDLASTTADRDEDQKFLDDTKALCTQKAADYEKRQALRAGEIEAIQKAIDIIGGEAVSGAADKHLPSLMQNTGAAALAQLRSNEKSPLQVRVAAFLANRADVLHSKLLSLIAQKAEDDPFKKVKKMIKDLVFKLMEEAREEAEAKGWCDTELTTNKQTRDKKSADIESLKAEIEELTAEIAQLAQDIGELTAAVKELDEAMAKATEDRTASKEKNQATIKDAKAAQEAVAQALAVLKEFYAKAAEAAALAQQSPGEDAPESFVQVGMHQPVQSAEGGGVIDFLEVISADFARLESETTTDEESEQEEYETFMFESKKDKALKENEMGHKTEKKTAQEGALHSAKEELAVTQEELDAALAYFEKLKPTCVDTGITYEERVKQREAEIQSLKEALKILAGESI